MHRSLAALAVLLVGRAALGDPLEISGYAEWSTESVIGISGLVMDANGSDFLAISDRGWWVDGRIERDGGMISGIELRQIRPILGSDGHPVSARRVGDWSDAEGLGVAADGTLYVSFERWAHVWRYASANSAAEFIRDHPTFYDYPDNRQLEALAISPDGQVYVFPERVLEDHEGFPIYRLEGREWVLDGAVPQIGDFAIVGADFDPDGKLFLLERSHLMGRWFQSRIRRIDSDKDEILWQSARGEYGNLEAISVWEDPAGRRITLMSDNNGRAGLPTEVLEFRLTD